MDIRVPVTALAAARVAYGAGLALAPTPFAGVWIGRRARDPLTRIMCRGFGTRDLVLGAGTLMSLQRGDFGRPRWWLIAQALADGTDLMATLAAGSVLSPGRRRMVAGMAAGSAATALAGALAGVGERPSGAASGA